ncbi:unnamed protein product [Cuscuta epithymum]|uniref:Uncharacterized protein n=1 Tax=Cuscuta epithymum TaxID=186058 RepID=A0AAV0FWZ7_9ASTE|nr:unnamed protein product [Cuscuta epithymum]
MRSLHYKKTRLWQGILHSFSKSSGVGSDVRFQILCLYGHAKVLSLIFTSEPKIVSEFVCSSKSSSPTSDPMKNVVMAGTNADKFCDYLWLGCDKDSFPKTSFCFL